MNLPKIQWNVLQEFITAARHYANEHRVEFYAEIHWSEAQKEYRIVFPKQLATHHNVTPTEDYMTVHHTLEWVKVMEIHSHHFWNATPSAQDNQSEIGTCLYVIVGRLDQLLPEITCRIYVEGVFMQVNQNDVFESPFTSKWDKGSNPFPELVEIGFDEGLSNDENEAMV